jgi:hypothetical protein
MRIIGLIGLLAIASGCKPEKTSQAIFSSGEALGEVDKRLEEASGLAASVANPGLLWTLNDNGNPPEVFLIDHHARIKLVCKLPNIRNRDWEDIAIGAGPEEGKNYVYVADIGDNEAQYDFKVIYRFVEPVLSQEKEIVITAYDTLAMRMPDGKRDAETILIDPLTHDLFIVSKRENQVSLYRSRYPFAHDTTTLEKVSTLRLTSIVAGSISTDGREVLLKNYGEVFYWKKSNNETLPELLAKEPIKLDYEREPQGEAIAWSRDGNEFYTLSESLSRNASLIVYKRNR